MTRLRTFWAHYALRRQRQALGVDAGGILMALVWAWRWAR